MGNTRFRQFAIEYRYTYGMDMVPLITDHLKDIDNVGGLVHFEYQDGKDEVSLWFVVMKDWIYDVNFSGLDVQVGEEQFLVPTDITSGWRNKLFSLPGLPNRHIGKVMANMIDE